MNKVYRCLWNESSKTWVAASEISSSSGKSARRAVCLSALLLFSAGWVMPVDAVDIVDGDNMYSQAMTDGTVFNLLGDAKIFGGTKSLSGSVTFNGQPGGSVITLNNNGSSYTKLTTSTTNSTIVGNNVTFTGGNSGSQGGAFTSSAPLNISGSSVSFKNNASSSYGGAIHINRLTTTDNNLTITADKFTLEGNTSTTSGGGIWTNGNLILTGDLDLISNRSGGYGGGIRVENIFKASGTDKTITITNNLTTQGGAGINVAEIIDIEGTVKATGNTATNERGGALRAVDKTISGVNLSNANTTHEFVNNKAGTNGGAIIGNSHVSIAGSAIFNNNTAGLQGGAVHAISSNANAVTIGNTSATLKFTGNKAGYAPNNTTTNTGYGGAIYTPGNVVLTGQQITVQNNIATNSAGAFYSGNTLNLTGTLVAENNRALTTTGGVAYALALNLTATGDTVIQNNSAKTTGGAFHIQGSFGSSTGVSTIYAKDGNITFSGNKSGVTFSGETPVAGTGTANALHLQASAAPTLELKAEAGKHINFLDPVTGNASSTQGIVNINSGTTGTITFSGENYTAGSAHVQSTIRAQTNVLGGTFEIKDNAEYGVLTPQSGFTVKSSTTLLSTGSTGTEHNKILAGNLTFENGSTLAASGTSELTLSGNLMNAGITSSDTMYINTSAVTDNLTLTGSKFQGQGIIQKTGVGTLLLNNVDHLGNAGGLQITQGLVDAKGNAQTLTNLYVNAGSTLSMGTATANLSITNQGDMSGTLSHVDTFNKTGAGTFTFNQGASVQALSHADGVLKITGGKTLNVANNAIIDGNNTILDVTIGAPAIIANTATLSNAPTINISGYAPLTETDSYNLIQTTGGVTTTPGQYYTATVAGTPIQDYVTLDRYLIGSSFIDATSNNVVAGLTLVWNNPMTNGAHGTFQIDGTNSFDLGMPLSDKTGGSLGFGWDGKTLTKTGTGTLNLNGINTYTGLTDVQAGKLIIGSSVAQNIASIAGDVDVHAGATLGGHGQIQGDVHLMSGSTIAPGNSIGNITVGNITFDAGSIYEFEVNQDTSADKITSTGAATLNGGTVHVLANGNIWNTTDLYTLVTTATGVAGTFDGVTTNLAFLDGQLSYDADNVYLVLTRNTTRMDEVGITENQKETGRGIESLQPGNLIYDTVLSMDALTAINAMDNLSGEMHANAQSAILSNSRYVRAGVNQHLLTRLPDSSNNLWGHTWTHGGNIKDDGNANRTKNKGFGFLIGSDYAINDTSYIGLAAGYEQTTAKTGNLRQSSAKVDAYHLMAYGKTTLGAIDVRAGLGYAHLRFDTTRNIWVSGLESQNTAKYNAHQLQAFIEGSHTFAINDNVNIMPYLNFSYTYLKTNKFNERGGVTALTSHRHSNNMGTVTIGVRGDIAFGDKTQHKLYADLGAMGNFGDKTTGTTMSFAGGQNFAVKGPNTGSSSALIGVGAKFELKENLHLTVGYEGQIGSRVKDHAGKATLQWRF